MRNSHFYFSMILMFVAGALAMYLIIRVANNTTPPQIVNGSEASYGQLQQAILKN